VNVAGDGWLCHFGRIEAEQGEERREERTEVSN